MAVFSFSLDIVPPPITKYKVILLAGDSNTSGQSHFKSLVSDPTHPAILQLASGSSGPAILADDPLLHPDFSGANLSQGTDRIGYQLTFARYLRPTLATGFGILLAPSGMLGSDFLSGHWTAGNPGGQGYELAIANANRAIALNAGNEFAGVLWHDTDASDAATYQANLDALVDGFRARITGATNSWFILGGMVPEWAAGSPGGIAVQAVIADTPNRKTNCAYWAGASGQQDDANGYADIHYSAAGQILNGAAAFNAGHTAGLI